MIEVEIDKDVYLDCYRHITEPNDIDIELIWGGRDSGKSWFLSQYLTEDALASNYFRFLLIKQTHTSIKDAQWQTLKDVGDDWGVDGLFKYKTSPLEITCINGNRFLARGMDEPGKIKSISNPSGAWIEEANQVSEESFITLLTTLRNQKGKVKLFLTFNPEVDVPDYNDFWLYKWFFKDHPYEKNFSSSIKIKIGSDTIHLKYRSTHTTYHDNPYCSAQRKAFHEALKETNYYWYRVFTLGEWGNEENDNPWAFAFSRDKHVAPVELFADRGEYLFTCWDFNRSPATVTVIQWRDYEIKVIEVIKLYKSGTEALCQKILDDYAGFIYIVNGDYSGNTPSSVFEEEVSNYTMIKNKLNLSDTQIQVSPNPNLKKNQLLVNTVLYKLNVQLCPVKAKPLIFDMEKVKKLADGTIDKTNRKDPTKQADALDCFRYFCNENLQWVIDLI